LDETVYDPRRLENTAIATQNSTKEELITIINKLVNKRGSIRFFN